MRPPPSLVAASLLFACAPRTAPATPANPPALAPTRVSPANRSPPTPSPAPEPPWDPDESCRADGYDFAYKVEQIGDMLSAICGSGPGTPCQGEASRCDGAKLVTCVYNKESLTDCRLFCREQGDAMGVTDDGGRCQGTGDSTSCVCCDIGEPGCENETRPPA